MHSLHSCSQQDGEVLQWKSTLFRPFTIQLQINRQALVLQSIHHLTAVTPRLIQHDRCYHERSVSWKILSEMHASPGQHTTHNTVRSYSVIYADTEVLTHPNSPELLVREPVATSTSVSRPHAAGCQVHLMRTSLGALSSGSYQNLHGRMALSPLATTTGSPVEFTWSFKPLKWTVGYMNIASNE